VGYRADIKTSLSALFTAIDGTGDFLSTVQSVEALVRQPQDKQCQQRPWIGFRPQRDDLEYEPSHRARQTTRWFLVAYVDAATDGERETNIENLLEDIKTQIHSDHRHSGAAMMTRIVSYATNEGDCGARIGWIVMEFDIIRIATMDDHE